ncbi:adenylate cyclase [Sorochytrium milnesiophthora]
MTTTDAHEHQAVTTFRDYLRVKTVHPNPDYLSVSVFLRKLAADVGLEYAEYEYVKDKPIQVLTWRGMQDKELDSIALNSHSDVVPVGSGWTHDPFAADKVDGKIYARGSQDMRCVGIQYVEAIRILKARGYQPERTLHVTFVPDEEIGGHDGMEKFVQSPDWTNLRVGLLLDEGLANEGDAYKVYYGERAAWWINVLVKGETGHGSQFLPNTAGPKVNRILSRVYAFRDEQEHKLKHDTHKQTKLPLAIGDVTTVNLTLAHGGVQHNVVPESIQLGFDIRITPSANLQTFHEVIDAWCKEEGVSWTFVQKAPVNYVTVTSEQNTWWSALQSASKKVGVPLEPTIFPATTDSRFVRRAGVPAIGVSPMRRTPILLHCHDEYLEESVFLDGLDFYVELLPLLSAVGPAVDQVKSSLVAKC